VSAISFFGFNEFIQTTRYILYSYVTHPHVAKESNSTIESVLIIQNKLSKLMVYYTSRLIYICRAEVALFAEVITSTKFLPKLQLRRTMLSKL
jgi:aminopeptidase-like protein